MRVQRMALIQLFKGRKGCKANLLGGWGHRSVAAGHSDAFISGQLVDGRHVPVDDLGTFLGYRFQDGVRGVCRFGTKFVEVFMVVPDHEGEVLLVEVVTG